MPPKDKGVLTKNMAETITARRKNAVNTESKLPKTRIVSLKKMQQNNVSENFVFNHYSRHSRLKRHIFACRERALQRVVNTEASRCGAAERVRGVCSSNPPTRELLRDVAQMELLYSELNAAMRKGDFFTAGRLKKALSGRRHRLQRRLRAGSRHSGGEAVHSASDDATASLSLEQTEEEWCESGDHDCVMANSKVYCSFYPDVALLHASQVSSGMAASCPVDERSFSRHPLRLNPIQIEKLQQQCAARWDDEPSDVVPTLEMWKLGLSVAARERAGELKQERRRTKSKPFKVSAHSQTRNILTDALDDLIFTTLQCLYEEQRTLHQKQPLLLKARQRYVIGFHEVLKWMNAGRVQVVLLASDLELGAETEEEEEGPQVTGKENKKAFHSITEAVRLLQQGCHRQNSVNPHEKARRALCLTCLSRHAMAYALMCKGRCQVGCVGLVHAEKYHYLIKAVKSYGEALSLAYDETRRNGAKQSEAT